MEVPTWIEVLVTPALPAICSTSAFTDGAARAATEHRPARAFVDAASGQATGGALSPRSRRASCSQFPSTVLAARLSSKSRPSNWETGALQRYLRWKSFTHRGVLRSLGVYYLNIADLSVRWPRDRSGQSIPPPPRGAFTCLPAFFCARREVGSRLSFRRRFSGYTERRGRSQRPGRHRRGGGI